MSLSIQVSELLDSVFEIVGIKDSSTSSKVKSKVLENYQTTKAICRAEEQLMQDLLEIVVEEIAGSTSK